MRGDTSLASGFPMADVVLRFEYSSSSNTDMRTFKVFQLPSDGESESIELYRFSHPLTGLVSGATSFHRQNLKTGVFETAGSIEWFSNHNATVTFGVNQCHIRELRKAKKTKSQSRRFKANGSEYKWKIAENDVDIFCVDATKGKTLASWSQDSLTLTISPKMEDILDRIVVTCFLNLWVRHLGDW